MQTPIEVAKEAIKVYNEKQWNRLADVLTPDTKYDEIGTHRSTTGLADLADAWKGWATALPDSKATITNAVQSGDTVVLEMTWRGTHTGTLKTPTGDIPATGKKIEVQAAQIVEVADGKVKSTRHYFDMGTIMDQLGVKQPQ